MKRLWIVGGIAAMLVGLGFVMPAIAQWRDLGAMTVLSVVLLILGSLMVAAGAGSVIRAVRA